MRKQLWIGAATLALAAVAFAEEGGVKWLETYEDGLKAAKEANRLLLVDFFTSW